MKAEYDNLLKYLAENYAAQLAAWLLDKPAGQTVQLLKTELSLQPARADLLAVCAGEPDILHVEFETDPAQSEPPLPLRMLDYFVRVYRRERCPVRQIVIVLAETRAEIPAEFHVGATRHGYRVLKLWEQDPAPLLAADGLLPLAVLAKTAQPVQLLTEVATRVNEISNFDQRIDLTAAAGILAGLRFDKPLVQRLFRREIMIQSSIYRDILEEGEMLGEQRGLRRGKMELLQELLQYRFGSLPAQVRQNLTELEAPTLEQLGKALFDLSSLNEVKAWLEQHKP
jgi:predicted transposase YdaD